MDAIFIKTYFIKNISSGLVKTVVNSILTIIALPLIIKKIGIETYGIISLIQIFSSFSGLLDLGLSKSLIMFSKKRKNKLSEEMIAIIIINISIALLILLLSVLIYTFKINILGYKLNIDFKTIILINSFSFLILSIELINNLLRGLLEANFKLHWINWGFVIQTAFINLGWLTVAYLELPIHYFLYVSLLGSLIVVVFHLIISPKTINNFIIPKKPVYKIVLNETLKFTKIGALNSIHLPIIKYSVIYFLGDAKAIGIFELSSKLAILVNNSLTYFSNPLFSLSANYNEKEIWKITKRLTFAIGLITAVGYVTFLLLNKPLIELFFKVYSKLTFDILNMLLIGFCFLAVTESIQKFSMGSGNIEKVIKYKLFSIIFNLVLLLLIAVTDHKNLTMIVGSYCLTLVLFSIAWFVEFKNITHANL